jgi:hypothetical protein
MEAIHVFDYSACGGIDTAGLLFGLAVGGIAACWRTLKARSKKREEKSGEIA